MNTEYTDRLFNAFPALYCGRHLPVTENLMPLGFCCGDGWFEILYDLSQQIQNYNLHHPEAPVIALQVKEKFGGLRFYVNQPVLEIEVAITEAERKSLQTCEITGQPGTLHQRNGYYQTLCLGKAREMGFEPI